MQIQSCSTSRPMQGYRRISYHPCKSTTKCTQTHEAKAQALHDFYKNQFGSPNQRQTTLNWVAVQMNRHDLSALDRDIEDEETEAVIRQTPSEKAPGPDGYVGLFYKSCWPIIKDDVTRAIRDLFALRGNCWNLLNSANATLLPKKNGA
jgi:hypothetical protein